MAKVVIDDNNLRSLGSFIGKQTKINNLMRGYLENVDTTSSSYYLQEIDRLLAEMNDLKWDVE